MLAIGFLDGLRPEPTLTVDEWADLNRILAPTASSEPGPWRTDRTPYLREPMQKLSVNDPCQEVVIMKGAQIGASEMGNNWIGYVVDSAPAPMMAVQPTDLMVKRMSKTRIDPMIESTETLRKKMGDGKSRDSSNTTQLKEFPGGALVLTGANSAVGLRMMPVRNLLLDEIDGYPADLDGEGSPLELAKARTRTFSRKKILYISTPTVDGKSAIQRMFLQTDQRYYFVPCPHCSGMQQLKWEQVKWDKEDPKKVHYECVHCNAAIDERHKTTMLAAGEWRGTCPENVNPLKVGYHLNSLYSPLGWYSWQEAVHDFLMAQGDANALKVFVNTVLGEPWVEYGDSPEWETVYNKKEDYEKNSVNNFIHFITAGVDVQRDRLELEIVGWGKRRESWSIDYRTIMGDTDKDDVWIELAAVLNETWVRPDKLILPMLMMAVDSGYNAQTVYRFCRTAGPKRAIPVKGQDRQATILSQPKYVDVNFQGKKIAGLQLWNIGVSLIKKELFGGLRLQMGDDQIPPPGYCHFPEYNEDYFKGLTSEKLVYKINKRGHGVHDWVKKRSHSRNEPLDCRVYARAAAAWVGVDNFTTDDHYTGLLNSTTNVDQPVKRKKRDRGDSFWN